MAGAFAGALLATVLLAGCGKDYETATALPAPAGVPIEVLSAMEAKVHEAIAEGITPGAVLVVSREGHLVEREAIGNKSLDPLEVPMTTDTIFDLASLSKVIGTATTTMLLIEDGKLTLDTRVADVLPEFAQHEKGDVTVKDLMTHSSGLKPYDSWKAAEEMRQPEESQNSALYRRIASLEKQYPTAEYINYSCLNYLTLARLNETAAGESQHSLLKRRVWEPLGMNDTGYLLTEEQLSRVAPVFKGELPEGRAYGSTHDPLAYYYGSSMDHCPGNAGLFSSAPDIAKYAQMILNKGELNGVQVFKPETIELMTSLHAELPHYDGADAPPGEIWHRALGWHLYSDPPYTHPNAPKFAFIGHTGYTGTYIWIDMNSNSFILLMANAVYSKDPPKITPTRRAVTGILVDYIYGDEMVTSAE